MLSGDGNLSIRGHLSQRQNNIFSYIFVKYVRIACMVIVCSGYLVRHGLVSVQNELSFQKVVVVPGRKK